jgi:hypothetical protein
MIMEGYPLASFCGLALARADGDGSITTSALDVTNARHFWRFLPVGSNVLVQSVYDDGVLFSDGDGNLAIAPYDPPRDVITYSAYAQWNFVVAHRRPDSSWGWLLDTNPATAIAQAADPNIFAPPVGGYAVRPQFDYDRNLNVLGDGPYVAGSQVQAWSGWSNASPNEVWVPLQRNGQPPAAVGA